MKFSSGARVIRRSEAASLESATGEELSMKRAHTIKLLALLALAMLSAGALAQPPYERNRINDNWAYGNGTSASSVETSTQYFGYVSATERYDANGTYEATSLVVSESVFEPTPITSGSRWLSCPVDRKALSINPNRAKLSAVLDPDGSGCSTSGQICVFIDIFNPTCVPWSFAGPVAISGDWQDSLYTFRESTIRHTDIAGFTTKESCQVLQGENSKGGFAIGNHVYTFDPGFGGYGAYRHSACNRMQK
jgi:hypothetical protein